MQRSEMPEFQSLLTQVLAFYRQDASKFAIAVWWEACKAMTLDQVRQAMTAHAMDPERGQFAPKPADLVRMTHGTAADRSLIAWGKVLQAMQRAGAYASVVFDDPAIHLAITDMGGWPKVCRSELDELQHVERRFCAAHRAYAARTDTPWPPKMLGVHEQDNQVAGRELAPPLLIGDERRCREVLARGSGQRVAIQVASAIPRFQAIGSNQ